jgi:hypothetical protein
MPPTSGEAFARNSATVARVTRCPLGTAHRMTNLTFGIVRRWPEVPIQTLVAPLPHEAGLFRSQPQIVSRWPSTSERRFGFLSGTDRSRFAKRLLV